MDRVAAMRLSDILHPRCIKTPLTSLDKKDAIFEMVDLMTEVHSLTCGDQLKRAVWERETTRTTGIGNGIAIPHGKVRGCPRLLMAIGKPAQPLEFRAIDGNPVSLIFLLASPVDETGPHILALQAVSQMLVNDAVREALVAAADAEAVYAVIKQNEQS